jgi:hypothetical protein
MNAISSKCQASAGNWIRTRFQGFVPFNLTSSFGAFQPLLVQRLLSLEHHAVVQGQCGRSCPAAFHVNFKFMNG